MKTPPPQRAAGRRKLAAAGQALPDDSFPIPNLAYLKRAIKSVGRAPASKRPALAALIRKRAAELKATKAPGVKGTWAFQAANTGGRVLELVGHFDPSQPRDTHGKWAHTPSWKPEHAREAAVPAAQRASGIWGGRTASEHQAEVDKLTPRQRSVYNRLQANGVSLPAALKYAKRGRMPAAPRPPAAMNTPNMRRAISYGLLSADNRLGGISRARASSMNYANASRRRKVIDLVGPKGWSHGWIRGLTGHLAGDMMAGSLAAASSNPGNAAQISDIESVLGGVTKGAGILDREYSRRTGMKLPKGAGQILSQVTPENATPSVQKLGGLGMKVMDAAKAVALTLNATPGAVGKAQRLLPAGTGTIQAANRGRAVELVGPKGWSHGWIRGGGEPWVGKAPAPAGGPQMGVSSAGKPVRRGDRVKVTSGEHAGKTGTVRDRAGTAPGLVVVNTGGPMAGSGQNLMVHSSDLTHVRAALPRPPAGMDTPNMRMAIAAGLLAADNRLGAASRASSSSAMNYARTYGKVVDLAMAMMTRRMPVVNGAADVQLARSGPGKVTVMHKSSGAKVGTLAQAGKGWQGVHASGAKCPPSGTMGGAVAGLVAAHNQMARGKKLPAAQKDGTASYAHQAGDGIDLAGSLPVTSSADGPRVTTAGGSGSGSGPGGLTGEAAAIYAKLIKKGLKPGQAAALARRAAAMHAKAAGAKAA